MNNSVRLRSSDKFAAFCALEPDETLRSQLEHSKYPRFPYKTVLPSPEGRLLHETQRVSLQAPPSTFLDPHFEAAHSQGWEDRRQRHPLRHRRSIRVEQNVAGAMNNTYSERWRAAMTGNRARRILSNI